jgi:hypothetical protein
MLEMKITWRAGKRQEKGSLKSLQGKHQRAKNYTIKESTCHDKNTQRLKEAVIGWKLESLGSNGG